MGTKPVQTLLTDVSFRGGVLTPKDIEEMAKLLENTTTLTDLNLSRCELKPELLKILSRGFFKNRTIVTLDLSQNPLGSDCITDLSGSFKSSYFLRELTLNDLQMNPSSLKKLAKLSHLQSISLKKNNLRDLSGLAHCLQKIRGLRTLDLSWNKINHEGAELLSAYFQEACLQDLNLSQNEISQLANFSKNLVYATSLTNLDLSRNPIKNRIKSLMDVINKTRIKTLNLNHIGLEIEQTDMIWQALTTNTTLTTLSLKNLTKTRKTPQSIATCLQHNRALTHLTMWSAYSYQRGYSFGSEGAEHFRRGLKKNQTLIYLNLGVSLFSQCWKEVGEEIRFNQLHPPAVLTLLLLAREFSSSSKFFKYYLPMDLFKYIVNMCHLKFKNCCFQK